MDHTTIKLSKYLTVHAATQPSNCPSRSGLIPFLLFLLLCISCSSENDISENSRFYRVLEGGGVRAEVYVLKVEPMSIGSYRVKFSFEDGTFQSFERLRNGTISDVWLVDLGRDGVMELLVWTTSAGSGSYGKIDLLRQRGTEFEIQEVAELDAEQRSGYMGHDRFEVRSGELSRSFRAHRETDVQARPTGGVRGFRYILSENRWVGE